MIEVGQLEVNYKPIQNIQQKKKKKNLYKTGSFGP